MCSFVDTLQGHVTVVHGLVAEYDAGVSLTPKGLCYCVFHGLVTERDVTAKLDGAIRIRR